MNTLIKNKKNIVMNDSHNTTPGDTQESRSNNTQPGLHSQGKRLAVTGICMFLSSLFLFFHMYYLMLTIYGSSRILPRCDLMSCAHTLHNLNFTSFVQHTRTCTQYIRVQCSVSRTGLVKHLTTLYRCYTFLHFLQVQPFRWTTVQFRSQQTSTFYLRIQHRYLKANP
jgi:hypothetical protein